LALAAIEFIVEQRMFSQSLLAAGILMGAVGLFLVIMMIRFPSTGLLLILAVMLGRMFIIELMPVLMKFTTLIEAMLIFMVWMAGLINISRGRGTFKPDKWWPYIAFAVAGVLAWIHLPFSRADEAWKRATGFAVVSFLFFMAPMLTMHTMRDLRRLPLYTTIIGVIISIALFVWGEPAYGMEGIGRSTIAHAGALTLADAMSYMIISVAVMALASRKNSWLWLAVPLLLLGIAGTFTTGSRGQLLVAVLMVAVAAVFWRRERPAVSLAMIVGIIMSGLGFIAYQSSLAHRYSFAAISSALEGRFVAAKISIVNSLARGGIGYGPGDVEYQLKSEGINMTYSHNAFVDAFNEIGALGGILFVLIIGACVKGAWRAVKMSRNHPEIRGAVFVVFLLIINSLLLWFKTATYYSAYLTCFFLGLGLMTPSLVRHYYEREDTLEYYQPEAMQEA
jgi:O-antigen ligase